MNRFSSLNQPVDCPCCGRRTTAQIQNGLGTDLCRICYDSCGLENEHSDGIHQMGDEPKHCPTCRGIGCLHETRKTPAPKLVVVKAPKPVKPVKVYEFALCKHDDLCYRRHDPAELPCMDCFKCHLPGTACKPPSKADREFYASQVARGIPMVERTFVWTPNPHASSDR